MLGDPPRSGLDDCGLREASGSHRQMPVPVSNVGVEQPTVRPGVSVSSLDHAPAGQPISRRARLAERALARRWRLPGRSAPVRVVRGVDVPMRDGTRLRADVYLPDTAGPHPTVLLRSPYGRGPQFAVPMALPYAARGYAVV